MADTPTTNDLLYFNGINGATGAYGLPPMTAEALVRVIENQSDPDNLAELTKKYQDSTEEHLGVKEGVDPKNLAESGWGVIFTDNADPAIKEALKLLLDLRQEQAGEYFRIFDGPDGYRTSNDPEKRDTKPKFLARYGVGPGPVDPNLGVPYYLLIVGSPEEIPYSFQYQLDVQFAVGRLHFDNLEDYEQYARSVVAIERGEIKLPRQVSFFGVENDQDRATQLSVRDLVEPLIDKVTEFINNENGELKNWQVNSFLRDEATKANLTRLLGGDQTPALLFTASHGLEFPRGDARQVPHQGALLCQDWPGPRRWRKPIPPDFYFSSDDVESTAKVLGLITFHFACYGAATPYLDEFAKLAGRMEPDIIAERPFIAGLPKKLLSHSQGGALAAVGHLERVWGHSFSSEGVKSNTAVFESMLTGLMKGLPVGAAVEFLNERYAELATELTKTLEDIDFGKKVDPHGLISLWTAHNDARDYIIIGDPAVRLPVTGSTEAEALMERPVIELTSKANPILNLPLPAGLVKVIQDQPAKNDQLPELEEIARMKRGGSQYLGVSTSFDTQDLAKAGWGVVFPQNASPLLKEVLKPLLKLRQEQASEYFKDLDYQFGESKNRFLVRHGSRPGPVDPETMPYYLLLVGSPAEIPYDFQQQLSLWYAVGRIQFDTLAEYEQYARSVVAAETGQVKLPRQASFFSLTNPNDAMSESRTQHLIGPLVENLKQKPDWQLATFLREQATKAQLHQLLGGAQTPTLLVANSYGVTFPKIDPLQIYHQGALLCQDWSDTNGVEPITQTHYFAGDDLRPDAKLLGLITFLIADYGGGTPRDDHFTKQLFKQNGPTFPKHPFVADLPKKLLSHPQGGALAVVGSVGHIWDYAFAWPDMEKQTNLFIHTIERLLDRYPIGAAVQHFSERYAELAIDLANILEEMEFGKRVNPDEVAGMWAASHDAGNWVIIGDPAVRLPVVEIGETPIERPIFKIEATARPAVLSAKSMVPKPLPSISDTDWQNTPPAVQKVLEQYVKKYGQL